MLMVVMVMMMSVVDLAFWQLSTWHSCMHASSNRHQIWMGNIRDGDSDDDDDDGDDDDDDSDDGDGGTIH
jgi:hypothetical protein